MVSRIQVSTGDKATAVTRKRYNRNAPCYDVMEGLMLGARDSRWRKLLWSKVENSHILEVGVGTGKNFVHYPPDAEIMAVDLSENMLKRAQDKARRQAVTVRLQPMDVQNLEFDDNTFDSVVASFVFCSVPDPIRGLMEVKRVCQPGGKVLLLEHVLSANRLLGWLMNTVNPLVVRITGANINRPTTENVRQSGLVLETVSDLGAGIVKLIEARKEILPAPEQGGKTFNAQKDGNSGLPEVPTRAL